MPNGLKTGLLIFQAALFNKFLMKAICLAGYSGHGFVVAEIINLLQYKLIGYLDVTEKKNNPYNIPYVGDENEIDGSIFESGDISFALGIGDNFIRRSVYKKLKNKNVSVELLQHPAAMVSSLSLLHEGTVVMAAAVINPFSKIGRGVICNSGCIIEHECVVGDFTHVAPAAVLAGNVNVGENTFIGANAFVKQGIHIGQNVVVGAGSVVTKNLPDNVVVYGNPAKIKKA